MQAFEAAWQDVEVAAASGLESAAPHAHGWVTPVACHPAGLGYQIVALREPGPGPTPLVPAHAVYCATCHLSGAAAPRAHEHSWQTVDGLEHWCACGATFSALT
jgi:hypothetical protein